MFPVHLVNIVLQLSEGCLMVGEYNLVQVSPAQGALSPPAEDSHPAGTDVADGVVALAHTPGGGRVQTEVAGGHSGGVSVTVP